MCCWWRFDHTWSLAQSVCVCGLLFHYAFGLCVVLRVFVCVHVCVCVGVCLRVCVCVYRYRRVFAFRCGVGVCVSAKENPE